MSDVVLALSTRVVPGKKFTVDGTEYQMLNMDHLSPEGEAKVMALFARHSNISQELELTSKVEHGEATAKRLRRCRMAILANLTDMPPDEIAKLPLGEQARLLEAIEADMSSDDQDDAPEEESGVKDAVEPPDAEEF